MMDVDHNLSYTLITIAENLREKDVQYLKFLCHDILPAGKIEKCNGLDLIESLSNIHVITSNNYSFLSKCLKKIHRIDLLKKLNSGSAIIENFQPHELNPFRSLLFDVALDLRTEEVDKLRFFYRTYIKQSNVDALSIFTVLLDAHILTERSFDHLVKSLTSIKRNDLANKLSEYCSHPVEQRRLPIPESRAREGQRMKPPSEESSSSEGKDRNLRSQESLGVESQVGILHYQLSSGAESQVGILHSQVSSGAESVEGKLYSQVSSGAESVEGKVQSEIPSHSVLSKKGSKEYYKMDAVPRGFCVIINNIEFETLPRREGAEVDQKELKKLFEKFKFTVKIYENLSSIDMKRKLKMYSDKDHEKYDCFICFILSHGAKGKVYGIDDKPVLIEDLTELFTTDKCLSLQDKPKLFFIQACQTENNQKDCSNFSGPISYYNPVMKADFSVFMSTIIGHYSYRCPSKGCRFIQNLTDEFSKYAKEKDLQEMITNIINNVSKEGLTDKQLPIQQNLLRKSLRFL